MADAASKPKKAKKGTRVLRDDPTKLRIVVGHARAMRERKGSEFLKQQGVAYANIKNWKNELKLSDSHVQSLVDENPTSKKSAKTEESDSMELTTTVPKISGSIETVRNQLENFVKQLGGTVNWKAA